MYAPYDLEVWEIAAASGAFAFLILAIASVIGFTVAWMVSARLEAGSRTVLVDASEPAAPQPVAEPRTPALTSPHAA